MSALWEWFCMWRFEVAARRFERAQAAHESLLRGASGWAGASECMNTLDLAKIYALSDMQKWSRRAFGK
jgi:hypothetical protein